MQRLQAHDKFYFLITADEPIDPVRKLLTLLKEAEVTINLKEYKLLRVKIDYLRFVICPGKFEVCPWTSYNIHRLETTTNLTERSSIPCLGYPIHWFVQNFDIIAAPFNNELRNISARLWRFIQRQDKSLRGWKRSLQSHKYWLFRVYKESNFVDTGSCDRQIGQVLVKKQPHGTN